MKKMRPSIWNSRNDVFSLAFGLYVLSKAFGNWPFTVDIDEKRRSKVRITVADGFRFLAILLLYVYCSQFIIYAVLSNNLFSSLEATLSNIAQLNVYVVSLLGIVLHFYFRDELWSIIVKFYDFDQQVSVMFSIIGDIHQSIIDFSLLQMLFLGRFINFGSQKKYFHAIFTIIIIISFFMMSYTFFNLDLVELSHVSPHMMTFFFSYICLMMFQMVHFTQYFFFLINIRIRFKQINAFLRCVHAENLYIFVLYSLQLWHFSPIREHFTECAHMHNQVIVVRSKRSAYVDEMHVRRISGMYDSLCDTIDIFNKCYSFTVSESDTNLEIW